MRKIANTASVRNISDNNLIYVDKTEYIFNLIQTYERVFMSPLSVKVN